MAPPTSSESAPRPFALRSYLAGAGVTAALVAGAIVVFLSAAAFVAFNGMPFGSANADQGTVAISSGKAPELAAQRAAKAGRSVAPKAVAISPAAAAEIARANGTAQAAAAKAAGTAEQTGAGAGTSTAATVPGATTPVSPGTTTAPSSPSSPSSSSTGPTGGLVNGVDNAASSAGVHTGLGDATAPITGAVDHTLGGTLNQAGGVVGNPHLGDQVGGLVNGATGSVLGH